MNIVFRKSKILKRNLFQIYIINAFSFVTSPKVARDFRKTTDSIKCMKVDLNMMIYSDFGMVYNIMHINDLI
uniref:Uncharacterized protein n=1 Tax=Heterorhabditis bacteriophora TaxID=37862 RepID=A0A1I7WDZ1_HETBA